jgi:hypothetical protein
MQVTGFSREASLRVLYYVVRYLLRRSLLPINFYYKASAYCNNIQHLQHSNKDLDSTWLLSEQQE